MAKVQAQAAKSAKPGSKDEKAKKAPKVKRVDYPGLLDAEGAPVKLADIPADFDAKLHKPLTRKNFAEEATYFELKARHCEEMAAKFRAAAKDSKALGNVADRAKAKKLQSMQKRMAELKQQLSAQGIDVEALLAASDTGVEETTEAAAS